METIGKRLRHARENIHQNKEQVMNSLGINNLGRFESDQRKPSIDTLVDLASYYGVSIDWIVTGKDNPSDTSSPWKLNEDQLRTANAYFPDLTEEQVALLNNFEKLDAKDKKEIKAIIRMKLGDAMGLSSTSQGHSGASGIA